MREVPVDFRIIADLENRGQFVNWGDVARIDNIEDVTVLYQPPVRREDGVFLVRHQFLDAGDYIGIVTAEHPTDDKIYTAVFPFRVGGTDWGYLPLFALLAVALQINYWLLTGGYRRWRDKRLEAQVV